MESAYKVLDVMKESGLEPSPETYTVLMVSYAEHGNIEGLNSVLEECAAADLHPHDRDLMEVILALSVKGHKEHVPQVCIISFHFVLISSQNIFKFLCRHIFGEHSLRLSFIGVLVDHCVWLST